MTAGWAALVNRPLTGTCRYLKQSGHSNFERSLGVVKFLGDYLLHAQKVGIKYKKPPADAKLFTPQPGPTVGRGG
jgi:hypothetical protein